MKILNLDIYYQPCLDSFYSRDPGLRSLSYDAVLEKLMANCFGTADFYSKNLKKLGVSAKDLIINDKTLQKKWAKACGESRYLDWTDGLHFPFSKIRFQSHWLEEILEQQILDYAPDILYCQSLHIPGTDFLQRLKRKIRKIMIVGQIASAVNFDKEFLEVYDLILSSFPHFVERFRKLGIKSDYFRIGFEDEILKRLQKTRRQYPATFVGSFSRHHNHETVLSAATDFWGYGAKYMHLSQETMKKYHGEAWGIDMYNILFNSKITLNRHINVAEDHANNMRLFEATGVGTMLITDAKNDLKKLFVPGKEVETYSSAPELLEKVKYYLAHPKERDQIAKAGQKRTLKDHTYKIRMQELVDIFSRYF